MVQKNYFKKHERIVNTCFNTVAYTIALQKERVYCALLHSARLSVLSVSAIRQHQDQRKLKSEAAVRSSEQFRKHNIKVVTSEREMCPKCTHLIININLCDMLRSFKTKQSNSNIKDLSRHSTLINFSACNELAIILSSKTTRHQRNVNS